MEHEVQSQEAGGTGTEAKLQEAVKLVVAGTPCATVARQFGIPRTTLRRRLAGARSRRGAADLVKKLTPKQEALVVQWAVDEGLAGRAPSNFQLANFVGLVLTAGGRQPYIGKHWTERFIRRHPEIRQKLTRSHETERAPAMTQTGNITSLEDAEDRKVLKMLNDLGNTQGSENSRTL